MLAILIGIVGGIASTVQPSINNQARKVFRSPFITAGINFAVAWLCLAAFITATEHRLYVPLGLIAENPPWIWLGGVCAVFIVTLNILCLPKLGAAGNVMIINVGQIITGLVIDHFALFGSEEARISITRLAGAVLVVVGMLLVTVEKTLAGAGGKKMPLLYAVLAFICGVACSLQIAVNGALKTVLQAASEATFVSMSVAILSTAILILVLLLTRGRHGVLDPDDSPKASFKWWMLTGGLFAITVVCGNAAVAPLLGTGLTTILNLIGMMGGGLVIDAVGFLGIEKKPITFRKVTGMLLMLAGTALISFM